MQSITHERQREIWENEHCKPFVLPQMDSSEASSGVKLFYEWLKKNRSLENLLGLEMACGKGRNVNWLANLEIYMTGFDFSKIAIEEAQKRARFLGVEGRTNFILHDARDKWPFESNYFDFSIDCFGSTDIEAFLLRRFARDEFKRVLKSGGYLFVYTLSTDDEFHKEMISKYSTKESGSFLHPSTGKFEKAFELDELLKFYKEFKVIENKRIEKEAEFFGKKYKCNHHWIIFQK